jgi:hypothetical protein
LFSARKIPSAPTRPRAPYHAAAPLQVTQAVTPATRAGTVTFPRSPEKLYVPRATRRAPVSKAFDTIEEESGCWRPDPSPAASRTRRSGPKLPVAASAR